MRIFVLKRMSYILLLVSGILTSSVISGSHTSGEGIAAAGPSNSILDPHAQERFLHNTKRAETQNLKAELIDLTESSVRTIEGFRIDAPEPRVLLINLRDGKIKVSFPQEFPSVPFKIESIANEKGETKLLSGLINVNYYKGLLLNWSITPLAEVLTRPLEVQLSQFLGEKLNPPAGVEHGIAYISIGCGGPITMQKYSPFFQQQFQRGRYVLLLLIDPYLTKDGSTLISAGAGYTVAYVNQPVYKDDGDVLAAFVHKLRAHHFEVYLDDQRYGGDFGGIPFPVRIEGTFKPPRLEKEGVRLVNDPVVQDLFAHTMATNAVIDDYNLNLGGMAADRLGDVQLRSVDQNPFSPEFKKAQKELLHLQSMDVGGNLQKRTNGNYKKEH